MLLPLLLTLASLSTTPNAVATNASAQPARPTLFDAVEQRMSAQGRPIFQRYLAQTLKPQAQTDTAAQRQYLGALHILVAAPTLDINAISALINQRKQTEAGATAAIRSSAFAMIRSLPVSDQKLALTAIFADARLPAGTPAPAAAVPAGSSVKGK
jgi:uncharacterized membrane protein